MKTAIPFLLVASMWMPALVPLRAQAQSFQIVANLKTVSKTKSERQDLPRGSTRLVEEEKILSMQIRRSNPTLGETAEVRWLVWMEDVGGRTYPAVFGRQQIAAQVGIPVELESEAFSLREREFTGNLGRRGSLEQTVKGYGILILDEKGVELASKFSAATVEAALRKEFAQIAQREAEAAVPNVKGEAAPRKVPPRKIPPPR